MHLVQTRTPLIGYSTPIETSCAFESRREPLVTVLPLTKNFSLQKYKTPKKQYYAEAVSPLEKVKALGFRHAPAKNPERDTFAVGTALPLTIKDQAKAIKAA